MILALSETLSHICDWIVEHCAELGITISIPVLAIGVIKLISFLVKNKLTIKKAVLGCVKATNDGVEDLKKTILEFKKDLDTRIADLERNTENKIDGKFEELKEKRKEIYNNIMAGIDKIETETQDIVQELNEDVQDIVEETVEEIKDIPEVQEIAKEVKKAISTDDILR